VAMGMKDAFAQGTANFEGMAPPPDGNELYISAVVHKAYVDVSETGTKAAAATGVGMVSSVEVYSPPPIAFEMDHPFLFLIRDNQSGAVLFLGRVRNPAGETP